MVFNDYFSKPIPGYQRKETMNKATVGPEATCISCVDWTSLVEPHIPHPKSGTVAPPDVPRKAVA